MKPNRTAGTPKSAGSACPVCGDGRQRRIYPPMGRLRLRSAAFTCTAMTRRAYGRILRCCGCGLVFQPAPLAPGLLERLYAAVEDPHYLERTEARKRTFAHALRQMRPYIGRRNTLLDVGSYCGLFLEAARREGFEVTGIEPSRWAAAVSRRRIDAPVFNMPLSRMPKGIGPFEIVTLWDVLEHLADPGAALDRLRKLLTPGGRLVFSTLDISNWFPRVCGRYWPWYMQMHLTYFTPETLRAFLARHGFRLLARRPYRHYADVDYLLRKLATLGMPLGGLREARPARRLRSRWLIPFQFGDTKLFVAEPER